MKHVRRFDVFPKFDKKFEQDARQRTVIGGMFSIIAIAIVLVLVVGEVHYFLSVDEEHEMYVDPTIGGDMNVTVNITFFRVPCDLMTLDAIDAFGIYAAGVSDDAVKTRVDAETLNPISRARRLVDTNKTMTQAIDIDGAIKENCPSCYGAEEDPGDCCFTCDDVRTAYERKGWKFDIDDISVEQCAEERLQMAALVSSSEGCNVYTKFSVARVTGNLHFIPGRMYLSLGRRLHDFVGDTAMKLNLSHVIHNLEFGQPFPGQQNPLDGAAQIRSNAEAMNGRFSYFVKIVPTRFETRSLLFGSGSSVDSNQYSVTEHFTPTKAKKKENEQQEQLVPGVFITYDLSPILIHVVVAHPYPSVVHFLLQLCAVCGGVLTVAGLLDAILYHGVKRFSKQD